MKNKVAHPTPVTPEASTAKKTEAEARAAVDARASLNAAEAAAKAIEDAVGQVLDQGLRTADIMAEGMTKVGTDAMGEAVVEVLG